MSSRSASRSRSTSASSPIIANPTAISSVPATLPPEAAVDNRAGPSTLPVLYKETLLTFLQIDTELPYLGQPGLRTTYAKYKEVARCSGIMNKLRSNPAWRDHLIQAGVDEGWRPVFIDLINIFIAKSQYYTKWQPPFAAAQKYREMVLWLENDDDALENGDLWDEELSSGAYTLVDLMRWTNQKAVSILTAEYHKITKPNIEQEGAQQISSSGFKPAAKTS